MNIAQKKNAPDSNLTLRPEEIGKNFHKVYMFTK